MYQSAYKYIEENYPNEKVVWSKMLYVQGAAGLAFFDHTPQGARGIQIHSIIWNLPAGTALNTIRATFTEVNTNQVLMDMVNVGGFNTKQVFAYFIREASQLNITCSSAEPFFTVEYQYSIIKPKQ